MSWAKAEANQILAMIPGIHRWLRAGRVAIAPELDISLRLELESLAWEDFTSEALPALEPPIEAWVQKLNQAVAATDLENIARYRDSLEGALWLLIGAPEALGPTAQAMAVRWAQFTADWDLRHRGQVRLWWRAWVASGQNVPEDLAVLGPAYWWREALGGPLFMPEAAVIQAAAAGLTSEISYVFEDGWSLVWSPPANVVQVYSAHRRRVATVGLEWWDPATRACRRLPLMAQGQIFSAPLPAPTKPELCVLRVDEKLILPWPERWRGSD